MSKYKCPGDFLKNAPEKERKALYLKAGKQANKDQRKIMNNYLRTKGTPIKQGKTTCSETIPIINKDKISTKGLINKLEKSTKTKMKTEIPLAEKLHIWYLEATKELDPKSYNPNAQKSYKELNEEQRFIDKYIAKKIKQEIFKWYEESEELDVEELLDSL